MSASHSTTMAEERLFPSALLHKSSHPPPRPPSISRSISSPLLSPSHLNPPPNTLDPIGAFLISRPLRLLQVFFAVLTTLLSGGIIFGFAALKPVLVREGVYSYLCPSTQTICPEQELRLNLIFTVAAAATNITAFLVGTVLDTLGPRATGCISSLLLFTGSAGMAWAGELNDAGWSWGSVDPYLLSYLLLALGGPFVYMSTLHLANAFPRRSGMVLSLLTGAFDASSAVFLGLRLMDTGIPGGVGLKKGFSMYLVVPVLVLVTNLFLMPKQAYKTARELEAQQELEEDLCASGVEETQHAAVIADIDNLLGGAGGVAAQKKHTARKQRAAGVWGVMHGKTVSVQLSSFWFWGVAALTAVQMLRINYFVATIRLQYSFLLDEEKAIYINHLFDMLLPLGGIAAIPFVGLLLDELSTLAVLTLLVAGAGIIGLLGNIANSFPAAVGNILLFCFYRPFYYTVVSDYCAKVFGIETFGKVYGLVICLAGCVGFLQQQLEVVMEEWGGGDPRGVNWGLEGAGLVTGIVLCLFVKIQGKRERRVMLGEEARKARAREREIGYGSI